MSDAEFFDSGFEELEKQLSDFLKNIEDPIEILEIGAKALVNDVRKLPKLRSKMSGAGYTHLIDTVTYRKSGKEIEAGWGKYYGPMVEKGTVRMKNGGTPHLSTTFERNKEKYYKKMTERIYRGD